MSDHNAELFVNRDRELKGFRKLLDPETPQAVMLVEAGELMGKTWLMGQMRESCAELISSAPLVTIDFKDEYERHAVQDALSLTRLIQEKLDQPEYFAHLDAVVGDFAVVHRPGDTAGLMPLIERIEEHYDLVTLERLATWLDVEWQNLPGDTIFKKAKGLVMHVRMSGDLARLLDRLKHDRDNVDWHRDLQPLLRAGDEDGPESTPADRAVALSIPAEGRDLAEAQINKAFITCLEKLLADVKPVVFVFDGCEEVPDEAERWIREQLLDRLVAGELEGLIVIFAARKLPYRLDVEKAGVVVKTGLDGFDEERAREFFDVHGVPVEPGDLPILVASSGGQPGMLARMVDNLRAKSDRGDPFFQ